MLLNVQNGQKGKVMNKKPPEVIHTFEDEKIISMCMKDDILYVATDKAVYKMEENRFLSPVVHIKNEGDIEIKGIKVY